jgi:dTDP-4-amino-4,6-dideoxygalactose transaminase
MTSSSSQSQKKAIGDLAILGGGRLFDSFISTSNLVRPDIDVFLRYSAVFYEDKHYTNNGPTVRLLEERLAAFHDTEYCITFANGFWALVLAIKCLAIPGKTEIIMPSLTYRRLADIAAWARLKPRFCDVDPETLAMTSETAAACVNDQTALILAVHPIVNCCDVRGLDDLSQSAKTPLLFDAVESVYETVGGRKIGSFGNAECFSLHASKLINGFEGGYVTTNDAALAHHLSVMRTFGFFGQDRVEELGMNAKLSEVHASMALACLDDIEAQVKRNRVRYNCYKIALKNISGIRLLKFDETEKTSYKNIVIELTDEWPLTRARTLDILHAEGALARPYYSPPLHKKQMQYPYIAADLPVTERLSERFMLLPCGHFVSHADIEALGTLLSFIEKNASVIKQRLPV